MLYNSNKKSAFSFCFPFLFTNFEAMHLSIHIEQNPYQVDLSNPLNITLGFGPNFENPNAFHIDFAKVEPIRVGSFVGSVIEGGSANCEIVTYCAHGNGTHTEGVGHIASERISVHEVLQKHFLTAQLITVPLIEIEGDWVIHESELAKQEFSNTDAIIIRTLPNDIDKRNRIWSGNNPPYFTLNAMQQLVDFGFLHLLTDLPSVDPEEDSGALAAHRVWWQYPQKTRKNASITELIYVNDSIQDGLYFLNLMVPKIASDAVPSQPILYPLLPI